MSETIRAGGLDVQPADNKVSPIDAVLAAIESRDLRLKRGQGQQWSSRCSHHDDKVPSLSISVGDDNRVLIYCQAGCTTEDVVAALGLKMRDLFPTETPPSRSFRPRKRPTERRVTGISEKVYAIVPGMISEQACPICVALYTALDLRCGRDNRAQRGLRNLEAAIHVDPRTIMVHARHLAGKGWIHLDDGGTSSGGHQAVRMWVLHNPARDRFSKYVRPPDPYHASRSRGGRGRGGFIEVTDW